MLVFICNHKHVKYVNTFTDFQDTELKHSRWLTLVLLAWSSAALHGHQSLTDGALPRRAVFTGLHTKHQRGRHQLKGVQVGARQGGHGEVGGASHLQHLWQRDLLQQGRTLSFH